MPGRMPGVWIAGRKNRYVMDVTCGSLPRNESLLGRFVSDPVTTGKLDTLFKPADVLFNKDLYSLLEGGGCELDLQVLPKHPQIKQGLEEFGKWVDECKLVTQEQPNSVLKGKSLRPKLVQSLLASGVVDRFSIIEGAQVRGEGSFLGYYMFNAVRIVLSEEFVLPDGTRTIYLYDSVALLGEKVTTQKQIQSYSVGFICNLIQVFAHLNQCAKNCVILLHEKVNLSRAAEKLERLNLSMIINYQAKFGVFGHPCGFKSGVKDSDPFGT